jgi:protease II
MRTGRTAASFYLVTNDEAEEFRLVVAPARAPGRQAWTEVIAGTPDTRLVSAAVFGRYVVVEQRTAPRPSCASWTGTPASSGSSRPSARTYGWPFG